MDSALRCLFFLSCFSCFLKLQSYIILHLRFPSILCCIISWFLFNLHGCYFKVSANKFPSSSSSCYPCVLPKILSGLLLAESFPFFITIMLLLISAYFTGPLFPLGFYLSFCCIGSKSSLCSTGGRLLSLEKENIWI